MGLRLRPWQDRKRGPLANIPNDTTQQASLRHACDPSWRTTQKSHGTAANLPPIVSDIRGLEPLSPTSLDSLCIRLSANDNWHRERWTEISYKRFPIYFASFSFHFQCSTGVVPQQSRPRPFLYVKLPRPWSIGFLALWYYLDGAPSMLQSFLFYLLSNSAIAIRHGGERRYSTCII